MTGFSCTACSVLRVEVVVLKTYTQGAVTDTIPYRQSIARHQRRSLNLIGYKCCHTSVLHTAIAKHLHSSQHRQTDSLQWHTLGRWLLLTIVCK